METFLPSRSSNQDYSTRLIVDKKRKEEKRQVASALCKNRFVFKVHFIREEKTTEGLKVARAARLMLNQ